MLSLRSFTQMITLSYCAGNQKQNDVSVQNKSSDATWLSTHTSLKAVLIFDVNISTKFYLSHKDDK